MTKKVSKIIPNIICAIIFAFLYSIAYSVLGPMAKTQNFNVSSSQIVPFLLCFGICTIINSVNGSIDDIRDCFDKVIVEKRIKKRVKSINS